MNSPLSKINYSKAAKFSTGNHKILQHKGSILSGNTIFRLPDSYFPAYDEKTQEKQLRKKKDCSSYVFRSLSRSGYEDKQNKRRITPGAGHYNINYDAVHRKNFVAFITKEKLEKQRASTAIHKCRKREVRAATAEKSNSRIDFNKQTSRKSFVPRRTETPHDKRFEYSDLQPEVSSKYRKSHTVDISKLTPRDDKMFTTSARNLNYNPNKEIVLRKLAQNFNFKSMTSRKDLSDLKQIPESLTYSIEPISRKCYTPDFSKQNSRVQDLSSSIPIFMQGLTNRVSLNSISYKTLQQNSYSTRDVYTSISTFDKPRVKKAEKDVFKMLKEHLIES